MIPLALFLSSFLLYLLTLNGTIPAYRDSGDLINAVSTLGIAHPPGYPLYVLLGKMINGLVPWANAAYRVNLLSAVCAAGSVALLYGIAKHLTQHPAASVAAALLYAVTPAVMALARVAEMYTLAAFCGAGIISCWLRDTPRSLLLGSFLLGCGFGAHPTLLFLAPLLVPTPSDFRRQALPRLGFFLVGFSVVFYLLVRAWQGPEQNWGNPSTLEGLWRILSRSNYGGLKLHPVESQFVWTWSGFIAQMAYFFRTLLNQWQWPALLAAPIGLAALLRDGSRRLSILQLGTSWILAGPFFFLLSNLPLDENTTGPILEPYLLLVNLMMALWVARGLSELIQSMPRAGYRALVTVGLLAIPLARLQASYQSDRNHFYAYDLGRNILRTLPAQAVLYDPDDPISFTLRALQLSENRRTDVALLNFFRTRWGYEQIRQRWPDLLPPVVLRDAQELEQMFWTYSIKKRPFYADLPLKIPQPLSYHVEGLMYPILLTGSPEAPAELTRAERLFQMYVWRGDWRTTRHSDFFTRQILNYLAAAHCNLGLKYAERRDWEAARQCYTRALVVDPHLSAAYNNLGVVDFEQGRFKQAVQNYTLAIRFDPRNAGYKRNLELASQAVPRRP